MTDRPIIFSAPMILALLNGSKTMTRRLAWRIPRSWGDSRPITYDERTSNPAHYLDPSLWQRVKAGDRLWVKENFRVHSWNEDSELWLKYPADDAVRYIEDGDPDQMDALCEKVCTELDRAGVKLDEQGFYPSTEKLRTRPSIYMPLWASRLTLVVTATKIERVMAISDDDAEREGIVEDDGSEPDIWYIPGAAKAGWKIQQARNPAYVFRSLWENLNGVENWNANPEVVAVTFTVHKHNIYAMPKEIAA